MKKWVHTSTLLSIRLEANRGSSTEEIPFSPAPQPGIGVKPYTWSRMKILLTGHKGYIGAVAGPMLRAAGHEVTGLDTDLFAGCDLGQQAPPLPELRKDIRDLTAADVAGFDAIVHLAALS